MIERAHFCELRVDHGEKGVRRKLAVSFWKSVLEKGQQFVMKTLIRKEVLIDKE